MKTSIAIITGSALSLLTLWVIAFYIEHGDINAMSMYFVVFLIPIILFALLNGLTLERTKKVKNTLVKRIVSSIPMIFCVVIALIGEFRIAQLDGNIGFFGLIGAIGIGLTNFIWNIKL